MAKSSAKKAAKKSSKKASKKSSTKAGASKPKGKGKSQPTMTSSGKGSTPGEIGVRLVEMVRAQTPEKQIWAELFHKNFESIEGDGRTWTGVKAVAKKGEDWMAEHAVHSFKAEGPFVGATGFSVRYDMDVEVRATGQRMNFAEVGVYTVSKGKVVREEFMYGGM